MRQCRGRDEQIKFTHGVPVRLDLCFDRRVGLDDLSVQWQHHKFILEETPILFP